ncbi:MAG: saccharopine dehydrogenase NADP-binding domain-containing protein [Acidobacteria bacterium]|uniref:Saccharopine dehydrogenase NADP-binding domain-containing protein n=1 Tax=Candidatus Polarisedimenticola svalbardensis TaxID=2886004 RepID=A0A8J7CDR2_9BACT|nr:saccharopine dehydrogenase NADP-binding domain-containing protein [Candidatus Polarisedimenticola svalbardensis]
MKRILVLGAGRVGRVIAADLATDSGLKVTVADRSRAALDATGGLETVAADLGKPGVISGLCEQADVVVGAVPGRMGLAMLKEVIGAGKPVADISFSPENPLALHEAAEKAGVPVVVDCGVAPGISNLLAGRAVAELDRTDSISIMVGGLPIRRVWPFEYRSVFSPTDVIEEYTRPCRMRVGGREVTVPALTGVELVDLPGVGTLEAFNTDGLRTLLDTLEVPDLKEMTLRFPGHADRMRMLRETGFFNDDEVEVEGVRIRPRALTEELMFKVWEPGPGEQEFTVLRVEAEGELDGRPRRMVWDLLDRTDTATGTSSMSRTTGFPCAIVTRMLADGRWDRPGVVPPELLGADAGLTDEILDGLASRGVEVRRSE